MKRPYFAIRGEVVTVDLPDSNPVITACAGGEYRVQEPFSFGVMVRSDTGTVKRYRFAVHSGFRFDGASIPRFFWRVIGHPFTGSFSAAALAHDYLYAGEFLRRELADTVFKFALAEKGVSAWKCMAMYYAVKWFGEAAYDNHTEKSVRDTRKIAPEQETIIP